MALRETLRGLCSKTGWCYAVFWKLKRRSRMVLTWEDGYYEHVPSVNLVHEGVGSSAGTGGNPLDQGGFHLEASYSQGQIELAVAKMSFCVHFMGEGVIGRVAFTGKHQWVFGDGDLNHGGGVTGGGYPVGWQAQFAAGIKTIAVIAVPQGVVQLGSTQLIAEHMDWVNHVKSAFSALHNVPGPVLSDLFSDGLAGKTSLSASAGTLPSMTGKPTITPIAGPFKAKEACRVVSKALGKVPSNTQGPERARVYPKVKLPFEDTWNEARDCRARDLQAVSETCSVVTQMGLGSNLNQPVFAHSEKHKGGPFREVDEFKGYPDPLTAVRNAMEAKVDVKMRAGLEDSVCPELSYKHEDARTSSMLLLNNSLAVSNEGTIRACTINESTQSQPQVRPLSAAMIASQSTGLDATAPSQSQTFSTAQDFASRRVVNYDAGNSAFGLPSIACVNGQEGNALSWGACVKDSRLDLCEGMGGTRSQPESVCPMIGLNVWESDCTVTSTSSYMPSCIASDIKSGCRDLELDCERYGTSMDELDKHVASLSSEQNGKWDLSFAIGDELSQALGPAFKQGKDQELWEEMLPYLGGDQGGEPPKQAASGRFYWAPEHQLFDTKSEALLEAVVANSSTTNGNPSSSSKRTTSVLDSELSVLNASNEILDSKPAQSYPSHNSLPRCFAQAASAGGGASLGIPTVHNVSHHPTFRSSTSDSSFRTILSTFVEDLQSMKSDSTQASQSKKPEELAKTGRKRARPGESARPRPKDRQQIQDRVRELREIVPNGSKCSIDALLEKTIKHMLFLQNVMLHADKLKKSGEFKDDVESGASWALEVGGDELGCPILVKNLNQPRQLLVEMFCEERGHFLEIADAIRSLGLTILKGLMESRMDKIWARFVVEANRDVHRVDVMMSLMQLLHVNSNSSSSSMTMASQSGPLRS